MVVRLHGHRVLPRGYRREGRVSTRQLQVRVPVRVRVRVRVLWRRITNDDCGRWDGLVGVSEFGFESKLTAKGKTAGFTVRQVVQLKCRDGVIAISLQHFEGIRGLGWRLLGRFSCVQAILLFLRLISKHCLFHQLWLLGVFDDSIFLRRSWQVAAKDCTLLVTFNLWLTQ